VSCSIKEIWQRLGEFYGMSALDELVRIKLYIEILRNLIILYRKKRMKNKKKKKRKRANYYMNSLYHWKTMNNWYLSIDKTINNPYHQCAMKNRAKLHLGYRLPNEQEEPEILRPQTQLLIQSLLLPSQKKVWYPKIWKSVFETKKVFL
jgi:hypothetical protein